MSKAWLLASARGVETSIAAGLAVSLKRQRMCCCWILGLRSLDLMLGMQDNACKIATVCRMPITLESAGAASQNTRYCPCFQPGICQTGL